MSAARFGAIAAALWAAHDLADHVVQTDVQARDKADRRASWDTALLPQWSVPMAGHIGSYTAVQLGALLALSRLTGEPLTWPRTLAGVAFSAISHAFLDRRWPVARLLEATGSPRFAAPTVRVTGSATEAALRGRPPIVDAAGPLPLHGPYLADQALHHACLMVTAAILAGGRRG